MNILTVLKEEHEQVSDVLDKLEQTTERAAKTRTELFNKLYHALTMHADFEEQFFYPSLRKHAEIQELVDEAYDEHHIVKTLLEELDELDVADESWRAKLKVLKEIVTHHVDEEEHQLFPKVKEFLESAQLKSLAQEYQMFKKDNAA